MRSGYPTNTMGGSLIGAKPAVVRAWAKWYRDVRSLPLSVDELLQLADRQGGTYPGITKTKIRKAGAVCSKGQSRVPTRKAS